MRRRKRKHRRYNNHLWVYSIIACICLLTMGVGYAILSAENKFNVDVTKTVYGADDRIMELLGNNASVASGDGTLEKITHSGVSQTDSKVSYRYRGSNPNNYVTFNNELWRIIGIVDGKVKLIRNGSIGDYSWDNKDTTTGAETDNGKNEWSDARLMMLLNPKSDGTSYTGEGGSLYWNRGSGNCYAGYKNATKACDFTSTGLSNKAKTMIDKSTWYLGGWNTDSIRNDVMYEKERGSKVYSGRSTSWSGYVGIMYASDYGYAASSDCSKTYNLGDYFDTTTCRSNNWLSKSDSLRYTTLTPYSSHTASAIGVNGFWSELAAVDYTKYVYESNGYGVRPTIYLKSNVLISGGDGSSGSPYQLTIN